MYVYRKIKKEKEVETSDTVWTFVFSHYSVGFYDPAGQWIEESRHETAVQASERVHWLNGGASKDEIDPALAEYDWIKKTTFTDEDI